MSPFAVLGLTEAATPDQVKAKWRVLAAEHHPDKGGSADEFQRFNKAYKDALSFANNPKVCGECQGSGKIAINRGFSTIKITCPKCGVIGND